LGRPLHGILGYSFRRDRVVQFDYPARVLRLLPRGPDPAPGGRPSDIAVLQQRLAGVPDARRWKPEAASCADLQSDRSSQRGIENRRRSTAARPRYRLTPETHPKREIDGAG
jgi:hypothetical protein